MRVDALHRPGISVGLRKFDLRYSADETMPVDSLFFNRSLETPV